MTRAAGALAFVVAIAGSIVASPDLVGAADAVSCGTVLRRSTTLTRDLHCAGPALVIGADGIRLDLGGHTIRGDGSDWDSESPDVGIDNRAGHDRIIVTNGRIRDYDRGILNVATRGSAFRRLELVDSAWGLLLLGGSNNNVMTQSSGLRTAVSVTGRENAIRENAFRDAFLVVAPGAFTNLSGEVVAPGAPTTGNCVSRNTLTGLDSGSVAVDGSNNSVTENRFDRTNAGVHLAGSNNRVADNRFTAVLSHAVWVHSGATRNTIAGNTITESGGSSILLLGDCECGEETPPLRANAIIDNTIRRSGVNGVMVVGAVERSVIARNLITDSATNGIEVRPVLHVFGQAVTPRDNEIRGNTVTRSAADGVLVRTHDRLTPRSTSVAANLVTMSGDDGIEASAPTTILTRNESNRNTDLGIEAVPGVIDGGGNRANGNGDGRQCVGVVCA